MFEVIPLVHSLPLGCHSPQHQTGRAESFRARLDRRTAARTVPSGSTGGHHQDFEKRSPFT